MMITVFIFFCLFVAVKTSNDDLQVQTVKIGENVIINCDQSFMKDKQQYSLAWFKQSYGKLPHLVVRLFDNNSKHRYGPQFKQRFNATLKGEKFFLYINETVEEDAGTYFCVRVKTEVTEFGSGTLLIFQEEKSQKRTLTEIKVKSGNSPVTLQCSVLMATLSCSGNHSVYWFRHNSTEPHPGIIYTHGNGSNQCKKSSETASPTQSCVYKLPKNNLSLSDAGTYYCAVAACGETVKDEEAKACKDKSKWIGVVSSSFSVISVILNVVLAVLLLKKQQKGSRKDPPCPTNQAEDTDALNYAAIQHFKNKPPPSRTPRVQESQDIYSQVKVR